MPNPIAPKRADCITPSVLMESLILCHRLAYDVNVEFCAFCCQGVLDAMLSKLLVGLGEAARLGGIQLVSRFSLSTART